MNRAHRQRQTEGDGKRMRNGETEKESGIDKGMHMAILDGSIIHNLS